MSNQTFENPFRLPVVHGRRSSTSNSAFERACLVHISRLQNGIGLYDGHMMSTFCEAVRMVREYSDAMQVRQTKPVVERKLKPRPFPEYTVADSTSGLTRCVGYTQ